MAIAIAAPQSGSGKTTLTLAMLAALRRRGFAIQSFKVGPDYIDPQFHSLASGGIPCRNLDPVLTSDAYVERCFAFHQQQGSIIEGVMGLFDGRAGSRDQGSTAHVARLLDVPLVLVIDAAKMGQSVAAIAYGCQHYDPRLRFAGLILNNVGSERHADILRESLRDALPILGIVPRSQSLPSRHLGLVPPSEPAALEPYFDRLAEIAETYLNWDCLLPLICAHRPAIASLWPALESAPEPPSLRIGVARDRAFSFYYADNLDLLRQLGAELVEFSPLEVGLNVPVDAFYLGGGFPELYAQTLSDRLDRGQPLPPIYAECGGLMLLATRLQAPDGSYWPMQAALPCAIEWRDRLTLGYRTATVQRDTPLLAAGTTVVGHEFHRSVCDRASATPIYTWNDTDEGWCQGTIQASYLHLHWGANPMIPQRWLSFVQQVRPTPR